MTQRCSEQGRGREGAPGRGTRRASLWLALALALGGCLDPGEPGNLVPRTVAEDPSLPSFTLSDGMRLHLQAFGPPDAPLLVVLHGGPGADHRLLLPLQALSDRYRVLFYDQRGTGLSERGHPERLTFRQYRTDLREIVDTFSPDQPVTLVSHSFGAVLASAFTNEARARVSQLVYLEASSFVGSSADVRLQELPDFSSRDVNRALLFDAVVAADDDARADFEVYRFVSASSDTGLRNRPFWRYGGRAAERVVDSLVSQGGFNFINGQDRFERPVLFVYAGDFDPRGRIAPFGNYPSPLFFLVRDADHLSVVSSPRTLEALRAYLDAYAGEPAP